MKRRAFEIVDKIGHDAECFSAQVEEDPLKRVIDDPSVPAVVRMTANCAREYSLVVFDMGTDAVWWVLDDTTPLTPYQRAVLKRGAELAEKQWPGIGGPNGDVTGQIHVTEFEHHFDLQVIDQRRTRKPGQVVHDGAVVLQLRKDDPSLKPSTDPGTTR